MTDLFENTEQLLNDYRLAHNHHPNNDTEYMLNQLTKQLG